MNTKNLNSSCFSICLSLFLAALLTGCVAPASKNSTDALVDIIKTANHPVACQNNPSSFAQTQPTMDPLPGGFGWTKLREATRHADPAASNNAHIDSVGINAFTSSTPSSSTGTTNKTDYSASIGTNELLKADYFETIQTIASGLKNKRALKNFIDAANSSNKVARLNPLEIYGLASQIFHQVQSNLMRGDTITNSSTNISFPILFEAYFVAYEKGVFTTRNGTVLGKPVFNATNANGLSLSVPDATISGIGTVFTEAVYDYGDTTPLFYSISNSTSYTASYLPADQFYKGQINSSFTNGSVGGTPERPVFASNVLMQVYTQKFTTNKDFFVNGKTPTAAAFFPNIPVVADYSEKIRNKGGITAQEEKFIRAMASLSETETKAVAGLLIRSLGSVEGGGGKYTFGSLHLSLGDNQMLAQLVENLLSTFSSRVTERKLSEQFWEYRGGDKVVSNILNNYEWIVSKVITIQSNSVAH